MSATGSAAVEAPLQLQDETVPPHSVWMHPAFFVPAFTLVGLLFAAQSWMNMRHEGYAIRAALVFETWGMQYLLWGIICWLLWRVTRSFIQELTALHLLLVWLPMSVALCFFEELIWTAMFPQIPINRPPMNFWQHVGFNFKGDIVESLAIFWLAFFFFRGFGYYQLFRQKEKAAAQLEVELANAKISALRMQLNPHFLFNTMNCISSLMRSDIEAADSMLEQLSSLLRMTLKRGNVQLIPLHEEVEFIETYLAMQDRRYSGRVTRSLLVDPELHDALVPAMILQPIVENAYAHGLSKLDRGGELCIQIRRDGPRLSAIVTNNGPGTGSSLTVLRNNGNGVGLANVRNRLRLHFGEKSTFTIRELTQCRVQVCISFPLQLSTANEELRSRFGD